jgi:hypothetical protein
MRKRLGNQRDKGILFAFGDVYQLCPAGHQMNWNLLDASSDAEPLCGQRFGNPLRPYA